jgi:hypothetical protein
MNIFESRRVGEEITAPAGEILNLPEGVHLRLVDSADGRPNQVDGQWPIITKITQELGGGDFSIYITVNDDPKEMFRLTPRENITVIYGRTNLIQDAALRNLCERYKVSYDPFQYFPRFDLPKGYVAGQVGPIYVGCDPEGRISS